MLCPPTTSAALTTYIGASARPVGCASASATRRSRASQRVRDQTLTEPSPPPYKIMGTKTYQQVNSVVCASGAPPGLCVQRAVQVRIQAGAARLPRTRTLQGGVPASTRFGAVTGDGRCLQRGTAQSMRPPPGSVSPRASRRRGQDDDSALSDQARRQPRLKRASSNKTRPHARRWCTPWLRQRAVAQRRPFGGAPRGRRAAPARRAQ